ncbi:MAG: hypothetical protein JSR20_05360 [Nitrospira sp.]|nr:hypothetical protein [Nitrospira sp.]MBS0178172.1 hypothetical protein [Nitrospira sp.]
MALTVVTLLPACSHAASELDLTRYDHAQDQQKIAAFYSQEAARLRLMARDLDHRAIVYERLFGPESDWVVGARLLARTYEDVAQDHELTAEQHLSLTHGR